MCKVDVGAGVTYIEGAVEGLDVFIPTVGTIEGTELIEGDCVGDSVEGCGDRVTFDAEVDDGFKVKGTWTGAVTGAAVS